MSIDMLHVDMLHFKLTFSVHILSKLKKVTMMKQKRNESKVSEFPNFFCELLHYSNLDIFSPLEITNSCILRVRSISIHFCVASCDVA